MKTKITKAEAKKIFQSGKKITLNPSKMRLDGMWSMAVTTNKAEYEKSEGSDKGFEELCNSFQYYNCSAETGKVIHFYKS